MSGAPAREAAVIASPKSAALYYDKILPLPGRDAHIAETLELLDLPEVRTQDLLLESVSGCRELVDLVSNLVDRTSPEDLERRLATYHGPRFGTATEQVMYKAACECQIVGKMELVLSELPVSGPRNAKKSPQASVLVKLMNLNLVDPSGASWSQILDFRQDPAARAAFVNLKNFLFQSCEGMNAIELQDQLAARLLDYERKSKQHGFETRAAACDVLLNSQNLIKCLVVGALGMAVGRLNATTPPQAMAAALTGTALVFDCTRAAIASKRKLYETEAVLNDHPANWVFLARQTLEPQRQTIEVSDKKSLFRWLWR